MFLPNCFLIPIIVLIHLLPFCVPLIVSYPLDSSQFYTHTSCRSWPNGILFFFYASESNLSPDFIKWLPLFQYFISLNFSASSDRLLRGKNRFNHYRRFSSLRNWTVAPEQSSNLHITVKSNLYLLQTLRLISQISIDKSIVQLVNIIVVQNVSRVDIEIEYIKKFTLRKIEIVSKDCRW